MLKFKKDTNCKENNMSFKKFLGKAFGKKKKVDKTLNKKRFKKGEKVMTPPDSMFPDGNRAEIVKYTGTIIVKPHDEKQYVTDRWSIRFEYGEIDDGWAGTELTKGWK